MIQKTASVGNAGKGIRSDCQIMMELTSSGGRHIELKSKVEALFGLQILNDIHLFLDFFGIENIKLSIEDTGALPCVIFARLEAALKLLKDEDKYYLPPLNANNNYSTAADRQRLSRLYLPGNTPSLMINAGIHKPDGIILDLEDAVAPAKKHEARFLVRNMLRAIDFYGAERMVRINQIPMGLDDLDYIIPHNVNLILVPKCESATQIDAVNKRVAQIQASLKLKATVWLMPIIESAAGVLKALEIASSENVVALAIGLEDYTADLGCRRTPEGTESFFARSMVVNAAKAAGIQAIDSVFSDVADMEGLMQNVKNSKALGFNGMGCIHPRQIAVIHKGFAPDDAEISKAQKIVIAFDEATAKGLGVVSLGTKMIDPPVVKRALNTIDQAVKMNLIPVNWKETLA